MSLVNEDGLDELGPLPHDLAEDDGLLEEEHLELLKLLRGQPAQLCGAVELAVEEKFALRRYLALERKGEKKRQADKMINAFSLLRRKKEIRRRGGCLFFHFFILLCTHVKALKPADHHHVVGHFGHDRHNVKGSGERLRLVPQRAAQVVRRAARRPAATQISFAVPSRQNVQSFLGVAHQVPQQKLVSGEEEKRREEKEKEMTCRLA